MNKQKSILPNRQKYINTVELTKRNKQIYKDSKTMSILDLQMKYRLSGTRIHKILRREREKNI